MNLFGYNVDPRFVGSVIAVACAAIIFYALKSGQVLGPGASPNFKKSEHPIGYWGAVALWTIGLIAGAVLAIRGH